MTHVSFEEYEAAKAEIIGGVQYKEDSTLEGSTIRKTYTTERGTFYEVNDGGRVEFWSDKHPESRIYDENERDEAPRHPCNNGAGPRLRRIVVGQDQDHDAGPFKAERL
ncbi:MAG: hypothetical protein ACLR8M_00815 [Oscillospiraceae bacterium]